MKTKYVLLIFVAIMLLGFIYSNYRFVKTGKVVGEAPSSVAVTVKVYTIIYDVIVECQQSAVIAGQSISANITITNKGNYNGDTKIDYWIEDYYGMNYSVSSLTINIAPSYSWSSIKNLTVPSYLPSGIYYFKARASAEDVSQIAYCGFEVTAVPSAPSPVGYIIPVKAANVEILYPVDIIITKNTTKVISIQIKNTGNVDLHNVRMILQGLSPQWILISPENITLQQNQTQTFEINLSVPQDAETGIYSIIIFIKSNELERTVHSSINVISIFEETEFQNKKLQIENEIEKLINQLNIVEKQEVDVSAYRKLIYVIQDKIENAVIERGKGNLSKSTELLYEAENLLEIAKNLIGGLKPPAKAVWTTGQLIGLAVIGAITGAIVTAILLKKIKISVKIAEKLKGAKRIIEREKTLEREVKDIEQLKKELRTVEREVKDIEQLKKESILRKKTVKKE